MRMRREIVFDSVLSEDIANLMVELGIKEEFERGEFNCHICNDVICYENFKLIFPKESHEFGFICNKPRCFVQFTLRE